VFVTFLAATCPVFTHWRIVGMLTLQAHPADIRRLLHRNQQRWRCCSQGFDLSGEFRQGSLHGGHADRHPTSCFADHAFIKSDNLFQGTFRLQQTHWVEKQFCLVGHRSTATISSNLYETPMPLS
jgi:hypothetical protein